MPLPPERRYALLVRGVAAATQLGTAAALTATGALVGGMAHEAHEGDAAKALSAQQEAVAPEVVVTPVPRPVRTVLVHRSQASPAPRETRATKRAVPRSTVRAVAPTQRKKAVAAPPKKTRKPAATTTSGS